MTQGQPDPVVVRQHLAAMREALLNLQVDQEIVASILREKLGDFEKFISCVESYLGST